MDTPSNDSINEDTIIHHNEINRNNFNNMETTKLSETLDLLGVNSSFTSSETGSTNGINGKLVIDNDDLQESESSSEELNDPIECMSLGHIGDHDLINAADINGTQKQSISPILPNDPVEGTKEDFFKERIQAKYPSKSELNENDHKILNDSGRTAANDSAGNSSTFSVSDNSNRSEIYLVQEETDRSKVDVEHEDTNKSKIDVEHEVTDTSADTANTSSSDTLRDTSTETTSADESGTSTETSSTDVLVTSTETSNTGTVIETTDAAPLNTVSKPNDREVSRTEDSVGSEVISALATEFELGGSLAQTSYSKTDKDLELSPRKVESSKSNLPSSFVPTILEDEPLSIEVTPAGKDGLSDEDEYFEEFHLPNTHENAFVRHRSYRRKVESTPIHAPDAEHIEGLVRTGDINRHGSIRRKILPEQDEEAEDQLSYSSSLSSLSDRFRQDIEEIETIIQSESKMSQTSTCALNGSAENNEFTSTPNNKSGQDLSELLNLDGINDSLMIGQGTIGKIRGCMNASKHKSIYHLSGRLQDILTPFEIQDVLNNSDLYSAYLTAEVLEALSLSVNDGSEAAMSSNTNVDANGSKQSDTIMHKLQDHNKLRSTDSILKVIPAPKINLTFDSDSTQLSASAASQCVSEMSGHEPKPPNNKPQKLTGEQSPLGLIGNLTKSLSLSTSQNERTRHIEINTITPIQKADPYIMSQLESVPPPPPDLIPEISSMEELSEERHWRNVVIGGAWKRIDMKAIAPYKTCISHGGFIEENNCSVIVLSACLMPERSCNGYNYIMDNIFMYALSYLEQLVSEDYMLVYLAGGKTSSGPSLHWMRKAYSMIDRNMRKNLKQLLVVHPSLWSKTLIVFSRLFVSSKFYRKMSFVDSLTNLAQIVPLDQLQIPDIVKQQDFEMMIKQKKR